MNPIYHNGRRLALGACKITPIECLYAKANETPAELRCNNIALKYYTKLKTDLDNPAHNSTFHPKYKDLFQQNENSVKTFGLRVESIFREAALPITKVHETTLFTHSIQTGVCKYNKKKHPPNNISKNQRKISQLYPYLHGWI